MEKQTLEDLLNEISDTAEQNLIKGASWWLSKTQTLHTLSRPYLKSLFVQQQQLALKQLAIMEEAKSKGEKMSVSEAELKVRATDEWVKCETTKGMLKFIDEQVKISKKRSQLESEERNNQY
jgi:hypothetical protein